MKTEKGEGKRILVYGVLRYGVKAGEIKAPNYKLEINGSDAPRFDDFDGLVLFQGAFETFSMGSSGIGSYLKHECSHAELEQRSRETINLLKDGGFVCLLMTEGFLMRKNEQDFSKTDLSKRLLSWRGIVPRNFGSCAHGFSSKVDDLREFVRRYGAAWSELEHYPEKSRYKSIAAFGDKDVALVVDGRFFAMPSLLPPRDDSASEGYLRTLVDGVIALKERLSTALPGWASQYQFTEEKRLADERDSLAASMASIDARLDELERLKRVLVLQSEPLVDAVVEVFERALPIRAKRKEDFREDIEIINSGSEVIAMAEIKGVSGGVAREHVNQADSHRERNGRPPEFPSLLIINTHHGKSASLSDKDKDVANEQVQHAAKLNVLILRTMDLLNLASLHIEGRMSAEDVTSLLTKSGGGWLKVGEKPEMLRQ